MAVNSFNAQNPPVTTKGDVFTFSTIPTRLAVGANDTVLTADSSTSTGLKWATTSAGGFTELASGSLSGSVVSLTSISGAYKDLVLVTRDPSVSGDGNRALMMYFNNDQTGLYHAQTSSNTTTTGLAATSQNVQITPTILENSTNGASYARIFDYANTNAFKHFERWSYVESAATPTFSVLIGSGFYRSTSAISRIDINSIGGSSTLSGTYILYGVK